jgi:hypothetical protein
VNGGRFSIEPLNQMLAGHAWPKPSWCREPEGGRHLMSRKGLNLGNLTENARRPLCNLAILLICLAVSGLVVFNLFVTEQSKRESGGRKRTHLLHPPKDYSSAKRRPFVFALHGRAQHGSAEAKLSHLGDFADRRGTFLSIRTV